MAIMTHRTTFSLDEGTATRIRELATQWQVSQAEVIRRVVAAAAAPVKPDPIALLAELHQAGDGLNEDTAGSYLADVRKNRQQWRGR
jgi:putative heme degradation protein